MFENNDSCFSNFVYIYLVTVPCLVSGGWRLKGKGRCTHFNVARLSVHRLFISTSLARDFTFSMYVSHQHCKPTFMPESLVILWALAQNELIYMYALCLIYHRNIHMYLTQVRFFQSHCPEAMTFEEEILISSTCTYPYNSMFNSHV